MISLSLPSVRQSEAVAGIISRNVFLLINGIILAVVVLLAVFGDTQEGIFLGLITLLNIIIGCTQEIGAWLTLEKLQLSAAPKVVRVSAEGVEEVVPVEEIKKEDESEAQDRRPGAVRRHARVLARV